MGGPPALAEHPRGKETGGPVVEVRGHQFEKACDALRDNAKDVCEEEAEGKEKVEKAELEHRYKPTASTARKVDEAKAEAAYEIAEEKCEDQKGDAEKVCKADAKAVHERAVKAAKAKG